MKKIIIFICLAVWGVSCYAEEVQRLPADVSVPKPPDSFKNYVPYAIDYSEGWGANSFVFLDPALSKRATLKKPPSIDRGFKIIVPINGDQYEITFDPGPSEDPGFLIVSDALKEEVIISGEILYVTQSGSMYAHTRSDEDYLVKRKYKIVGHGIREVAQPFYLVAMKCRTTSEMLLYEERCAKGEVVAKLPEGAEVTVLLNEVTSSCYKNGEPHGDEQYLVATPFGLVGWVTSESGYLETPGKPLGCLNYFGD